MKKSNDELVRRQVRHPTEILNALNRLWANLGLLLDSDCCMRLIKTHKSAMITPLTGWNDHLGLEVASKANLRVAA